MDIQQTLSLLIVVIAAAYLGRNAYRAWKRLRGGRSGCESGCGKCGFASGKGCAASLSGRPCAPSEESSYERPDA